MPRHMKVPAPAVSRRRGVITVRVGIDQRAAHRQHDEGEEPEQADQDRGRPAPFGTQILLLANDRRVCVHSGQPLMRVDP